MGSGRERSRDRRRWRRVLETKNEKLGDGAECRVLAAFEHSMNIY